jgi:hypothetical protein
MRESLQDFYNDDIFELELILEELIKGTDDRDEVVDEEDN